MSHQTLYGRVAVKSFTQLKAILLPWGLMLQVTVIVLRDALDAAKTLSGCVWWNTGDPLLPLWVGSITSIKS